METITILLTILVIFCAISIWFVYFYDMFQENIVRINEAEVEIDSILRKRYDLLNKSNDVINEFINGDKSFDIVESMRNQKLSNFDLDKKIHESIKVFKTYKKENEEIIKNEQFIKIEVALNETEAEITASRKYYNDVIIKYNKLVKRMPSKFVAMACKYKEKKLYNI